MCKGPGAHQLQLLPLLLPFLLTFGSAGVCGRVSSPPAGDELLERVAALVLPEGYPLELHFVTTSDGYVLRLYRIPRGQPGPADDSASEGWTHLARQARAKFAQWWNRSEGVRQQVRVADVEQLRPPVLLQHGLLDSCAAFLLNGPRKALAFILADAGFDVWLGNARGSTHSLNHTRWALSDPRFWMFSWDDMARADLPAELDYILDTTGFTRLAGYVGHSQGTTVALASLASQPQLADRLGLVSLMAPVAYVTHINSLPLMALARMDTDQVFKLLGIHSFMPSQAIISVLEGQLCRAAPALCANILSAIAGYNLSNIDASRLPLYLEYTPAGSSVQNMAHWSQMVRQPLPNLLPWFDWGQDCTRSRGGVIACNQVLYGQLDPPMYRLGDIVARIALFTGGHDRLSDVRDQMLLLQSLPPVHRHIHIDSYEHLDFTWGKDAPSLVYEPILEMLREEVAAMGIKLQGSAGRSGGATAAV